MKYLSLIIALSLFCSNVFCVELQSELHLISPPSVLKEGDLIQGVLKVWPIENLEKEEFKSLSDKVFANALVVTEIESVDVSPNNADVVEVKILFIVKKIKENNASLVSYKGQLINVQLPPLKIESIGEIPKEYFVMNQAFLSSNQLMIAIGLFVLLILGVLIWKKEKLRMLFRKFKSDPVAEKIKKYHKIFSEASSRESFEDLYADKKNWFPLIKVQAPVYQEFFNVMEQHQYKKMWTAEELEEVKNTFDIIRGSFK